MDDRHRGVVCGYGVNMFGFGKKQIHRIGIDIGRDGLRLAQLVDQGKDLSLLAGNAESCPPGLEPGSASWQRWAIDAIKQNVPKGGFRGKEVCAVLPASDVFIEHIKMPRQGDSLTEDYIFNRIKNKIPFRCSREDTMVKMVACDKDHAVVMAAEREVVNRHLAIYEMAGVDIKTLGVWPEALVRCYVQFFGRRKSDLNDVVILVDIEAQCTNLVICRHSNLLFARSISLGADALADEAGLNRAILEVGACRRDYAAMYKNSQLSRLIFMSGAVVDTSVYAALAKKMEIQAQIGDCLVAVEMSEPLGQVLDRRDQHISWATAFGLSLS
jgi:Tfp pilus assembly PilM family ATPase